MARSLHDDPDARDVLRRLVAAITATGAGHLGGNISTTAVLPAVGVNRSTQRGGYFGNITAVSLYDAERG